MVRAGPKSCMYHCMKGLLGCAYLRQTQTIPSCARCAASMAMSTLINGADAGVAIVTSAVAAANATLIRAHQVVGQVDGLASDWAQSPVGNIIGAQGRAHTHWQPHMRARNLPFGNIIGSPRHACAACSPVLPACKQSIIGNSVHAFRGACMRILSAMSCMQDSSHGRAQPRQDWCWRQGDGREQRGSSCLEWQAW